MVSSSFSNLIFVNICRNLRKLKMAKEYSGSPKPHHIESKRKRLTYIVGVSGLCILFYVLGAWQATYPGFTNPSGGSTNKVTCNVEKSASTDGQPSSASSVALDFESHHQVATNDSGTAAEGFPPCDMAYSEYTPCQYPPRGRKFDRNMLKYRERHCPTKEELLRCLIPAPPKYKTPFKWPQSRDYAWYDNIPHRELSIEKAVQNWVQVEGDRFRFPGGGTMFPRGADAYIDDINELIPLTGGKIRTAVDTGCGVSSSSARQRKDLLTIFFFFIFNSMKLQVVNVHCTVERGPFIWWKREIYLSSVANQRL